MTTANPTAPVKTSPFKVFRNRNFSLMWTGQLVETMGTALTSLASSIFVYRMTNSAMSVGLMLMAASAPSLLIGLFAGVIVDRVDRKKIMVYTSLARALLVFLIPFLVPKNVIWMYAIVFLSNAIAQFFDPAHESVLPEVASEEDLAAANSLMAISAFGSTAIGFAASGFIAAAADISWAFYLNALTFIFSAICIFLTKINPMQSNTESDTANIFENLKIGVKQLFKTPVLRSVFNSQILTLIAIGMMNTLLLPFALNVLKANEAQYGLQEALTSVGFVIASLLVAGIFDRLREGTWIAASSIGMAIAGIAYSFTRSIPLAIGIVTVSGFLNAPASIGRRLLIQRNTPREMRGRVNSVFFVSRDILFLAGMGAAGLADLDFIGIPLTYLISAVLFLGGGLFCLVLPGLRQNKAEWKRALNLLKATPVAPSLSAIRPAQLADFDLLTGMLPSLTSLTDKERNALIAAAEVIEVKEGETILRHGETSDAAYFILDGKTVAGIATEEGKYHSLSSMGKGDFFGEIAALTGVKRTADVVATQPSILLQVPAETLRSMMGNPVLNKIIRVKMAERIARTSLNELPRFAGVDQQDAQSLRSAPAVD